jgi:hypothetical protein
MRLLQQFNALIWSWGEMFRALGRGVAVMPLALYGGVQTLIVLAVVGFAYPPLSVIVAPALRWRFGEAALHYPNNFFVLRSALGQADTVLWVILGAVLSAAAVHMFAAFYGGRREGLASGWQAAARRYLPVVLIAAIVMTLTHLIAQAPSSIWGDLAERSPTRFRIVRAGGIALVVAVQALFLYVVPYLVIDGRRLGAAVLGSLALAWKHPVTTYLIVGIPASVELLPLWLSRNSLMIARRLSPEFLVFVMAVWIIAIFFASYAAAGSSTRFFLHSTQDEAPLTQGREG